jgi:dTDP-4-amino-4,6-dideoxygalactose transaminase
MGKNRLEELAVLGGTPSFDAPLHVGRPNIGDRVRLNERINEALDRRWLSNDGPFVREFEQRLCEMLGVRHCIAMCNATVALEITARALELSGEVIVPAFTFVATAHALTWQGLTPIFCDVDPVTHNLDLKKIESLITPRTTGIVGVHVWGRACDTDAIDALAKRHALRVMYDAAHAFLCSHDQRMLGAFGDAEVFSFHATKFCNAFEGGAVATDDDALAERIRLLRNFGFADYDTVTHLGVNGKMTEVCAAMGLTSLESVGTFVDANRRNYLRYRAELSEIPGLQLIDYDDREHNNYQYVVVEVNPEVTGIARDGLQQVLWAENVMARRYFHPGVHRMEPYRTRYPDAPSYLLETESLTDRVLCLPTGTAVGSQEIRGIADVLRTAVESGAELQMQMCARGVSSHGGTK